MPATFLVELTFKDCHMVKKPVDTATASGYRKSPERLTMEEFIVCGGSVSQHRIVGASDLLVKLEWRNKTWQESNQPNRPSTSEPSEL
jgi:hypothetical protein